MRTGNHFRSGDYHNQRAGRTARASGWWSIAIVGLACLAPLNLGGCFPGEDWQRDLLGGLLFGVGNANSQQGPAGPQGPQGEPGESGLGAPGSPGAPAPCPSRS